MFCLLRKTGLGVERTIIDEHRYVDRFGQGR